MEKKSTVQRIKESSVYQLLSFGGGVKGVCAFIYWAVGAASAALVTASDFWQALPGLSQALLALAALLFTAVGLAQVHLLIKSWRDPRDKLPIRANVGSSREIRPDDGESLHDDWLRDELLHTKRFPTEMVDEGLANCMFHLFIFGMLTRGDVRDFFEDKVAEEFLKEKYRAYLEREIDCEGYTLWAGALHACKPERQTAMRDRLTLAIKNSVEAKQKLAAKAGVSTAIEEKSEDSSENIEILNEDTTRCWLDKRGINGESQAWVAYVVFRYEGKDPAEVRPQVQLTDEAGKKLIDAVEGQWSLDRNAAHSTVSLKPGDEKTLFVWLKYPRDYESYGIGADSALSPEWRVDRYEMNAEKIIVKVFLRTERYKHCYELEIVNANEQIDTGEVFGKPRISRRRSDYLRENLGARRSDLHT